jgi:hypothetical protein
MLPESRYAVSQDDPGDHEAVPVDGGITFLLAAAYGMRRLKRGESVVQLSAPPPKPLL